MTATPKTPQRRAPVPAPALAAVRQVLAVQQAAQARLQEQQGDALDDLRRKQAQAQQQQL